MIKHLLTITLCTVSLPLSSADQQTLQLRHHLTGPQPPTHVMPNPQKIP